MSSSKLAHRFLEDRLCDEASRLLNGWQGRLDPGGYQDPATGWFRRGTVRSVLAGLIQRQLAAKPSAKWLVLSEQPYPEGAPGSPLILDLWLQGPSEEETIAVLVKSDFDLDQAKVAYQQLIELKPRRFHTGYLFFCADRLKVADWQEEIEASPHDRVTARGIGRQPLAPSPSRHPHRRRE
ncbi:MAG TPA: hypothetical protein VF017_02680 [Thermoanaerobaculia bacterium]|nr:hypothetical protein [Thermoanaerobaculia bacterium]